MTFGDQLRYWRKDIMHWTQEEAAQETGTTASLFSRWERNHHRVSPAYQRVLKSLGFRPTAWG